VPYVVRNFPATVYPAEVLSECPEAMEIIDVMIREMCEQGPRPDGYHVKTLGKAHGGLGQINLRANGEHVRVVFAPYGKDIVLFRVHKKLSPQEQKRAYQLAVKRKAEYEKLVAGH
jgi:hypothetical protein